MCVTTKALTTILLCAVPAIAADEPTRVLATTTELRCLAEEVGGTDVEVTCLMKGPEDPHFLEARPSFVRAAAAARVLLLNGLDLEVGYEPVLLSDSRNGVIQRGRPGHVDCSLGIHLLEIPAGKVDRSMGDVHASGNPHYLLDPVRAKAAAGTVAEALATAAPEKAQAFRERLAAFRRRVDVAMFGEELLAEQPVARLERRLADGTLLAFLEGRGLAGKLHGHAATLAPSAGRQVVDYHGTFVYLLDRFHLRAAARLEPRPGVPPTARHLRDVVTTMRTSNVTVVLHTSFQSQRSADAVAKDAGGTAVRLAHQPGAVPGTDTYLDALAYNVAALAKALRPREEPR